MVQKYLLFFISLGDIVNILLTISVLALNYCCKWLFDLLFLTSLVFCDVMMYTADGQLNIPDQTPSSMFDEHNK